MSSRHQPSPVKVFVGFALGYAVGYFVVAPAVQAAQDRIHRFLHRKDPA